MSKKAVAAADAPKPEEVSERMIEGSAALVPTPPPNPPIDAVDPDPMLSPFVNYAEAADHAVMNRMMEVDQKIALIERDLEETERLSTSEITAIETTARLDLDEIKERAERDSAEIEMTSNRRVAEIKERVVDKQQRAQRQLAQLKLAKYKMQVFVSTTALPETGENP